MTDFLNGSGLMRLIANFNPAISANLTFDGIDKETLKQNRMLNLKNYYNETVKKEGEA